MVASLHDQYNLADIRWISDGFEPWLDFNEWLERQPEAFPLPSLSGRSWIG